MADSPPPTPSDVPLPPSLDTSDWDRSTTRENTPASDVPPDPPTTPKMGKINYKIANTTPYHAQTSVSGVSKYESGKRKGEFYTSLYGAEAGQHQQGAFSMDSFLELCFSGVITEDVFSTFKDDQVEELQRRLAAVNPGPVHNRERPMYPLIIPALQYIFTIFKDLADHATLQPLVAHDVSRAYQKGDDDLHSIAPDLVIDVGDERSEPGQWTHALGLIEVKADKEKDPAFNNVIPKRMNTQQVEAWSQIQEYGAVAFQARPRCYLLGIGFYDDIARFYRWDHSAVIFSTSFNYKDDCAPLLRFLYGFVFFGNNNNMGVDATITRPLPNNQGLSLALLERIYRKAREEKVIARAHKVDQNALLSQSLTMVVPPSLDHAKQENYVTLSSPLFSSRSLFGRGTKTWLAVPATLIDSACPSGEELEHAVVIKDYWREVDRLTEKEIYDRIHAGGHVVGVARCRTGFDVDSVDDTTTQQIHNTCVSRVNALLPEAKFCEHKHYRCILESVGIPLTRFRSTRQLLEAVRDVVKALRDLAKKGILHRDISVHNIMISALPEREHGAVGFLIDPDLRRITGTIQFISLKLLTAKKSIVHEDWHDLESVFWVLLFTVVRHVRTNLIKEDIHDIFDGTKGNGRSAWILGMSWDTVEVENHPPLTRCVHELARLVASHYGLITANLLTHDAVLKALDDALVAQDWPKKDPKALEFQRTFDETTQMNRFTGVQVASTMRSSQASGLSGPSIHQMSQQSGSRKRKADTEKE
ncbi:hypothetical protein GLOTRDRAFT_134120 [Gloeophyllum trabeum ATCC 11539]|uniref:Fungal-type protein kinase domain-containing protein n=1 Tax=Gloeophyllum trabeum (strain ATCC 11539 / FP-39264 / Madison 617) TaxID=670483 RepID=S7RCW2_GLOTA|nr:uncharacterized protein GLOTRDRAFT_134120 [Gloeophyllum trabeum ATCC 11539]EPQ50249.1 hypothetical protein GLOTRDRAFT_134120 [Gloeophyllum trabeum ATCC 11539]